MADSSLIVKSKAFALDVIQVCKADFIAKLQIALKECSETEYWIELVLESGYYHDKTLLDQCTELKRILISSLNTAKANQDKN